LPPPDSPSFPTRRSSDLIGGRMHFSHDPVGSCCERSFGTFCHNFLASGGMCNINHDGKMGRLFQKWNCRDIQSIPSTFFIRPNPSFAKDYTGVPLCKYILGSI